MKNAVVLIGSVIGGAVINGVAVGIMCATAIAVGDVITKKIRRD